MSSAVRRLPLRTFGLAAALVLGVLAVGRDASAQKKTPPEDKAPKSDGRSATLELVLAVGENKSIPALEVKNYSEGTPGIIDVKLTSDSQSFVVVGLKPGTTSLLLIKKNGSEINWTINVFARSPAIVEAEVQQLLEGYPTVKIRRVGARFFLDGTVSSEAEVKRIAQIATLYPGQVESLVSVGAKDRTTNIRIDFYFVQYNKDSSYQVGLSMPTKIGGPFLTSALGYDFVGRVTTATTSLVNQPLPGLDIAATHGWAKVIRQATVITTNGADASFENGGEQNFAVAAGLTSSIQKIQFGVTLKVQPFFDPATKELDLRVNADVADLVPSVSATPLPGRQTTKLETMIHMKLGQSLVISGFHTKSETSSISGLPLLSRIPILGVLFGSRGSSKGETEGVIFVVPTVVESTSKSASDLVNEALTAYEDFDGDMPHTLKKMTEKAPK